MDSSVPNDRFLEGSFPIIPATGTEVGHVEGSASRQQPTPRVMPSLSWPINIRRSGWA